MKGLAKDTGDPAAPHADDHVCALKAFEAFGGGLYCRARQRHSRPALTFHEQGEGDKKQDQGPYDPVPFLQRRDVI